MIFLITWAPPRLADKAGTSEGGKPPIYITISGFRDEGAGKSCLGALNRDRKRPLAIPEKGEGEFQIIIEKKRPGFQVRIEKMGMAIRTARALFDYEVCIAAAAIAREAISDD